MITPIMTGTVIDNPNEIFQDVKKLQQEKTQNIINNVTEQVNSVTSSNPFLAVAVEATTSNSITEGLIKLQTEEVISRYPDGITITKFDLVNNEDKQFCVVLFKETPTAYYAGGQVLTDICQKWKDLYGDCETASTELEKCGGVRVKLSKAISKKSNRSYTKVEVVQ